MSNVTVGREPVQIVKVTQQLCARVFGASPCAATTIGGDASTKCFNTYATCRDQANYLAGAGLDLYFSKPNFVAAPADAGLYVIPSLVSATTAPTTLNITGADSGVSPLGYRAVLNVNLSDAPHTDRIVDPYLTSRSYDPMTAGSFWSKWLLRNRFYRGFPITIHDGYAGQALADMKSREYIITSISGPDSSGRVSISAKDILSRASADNAMAPVVSAGELYADIDDAALEFVVAGGLVSDYAASGSVKVGNEIMLFSGITTNLDGRLVFSLTMRGADGSMAEAHEATDNVQNVLEYTAMNSWDIVKDLLVNHAGIDAGYIVDADWATEGGLYLADYVLTAKIAEPTSVLQLVAEICEQSLFYIWWDESVKNIRMRAVRGVTSPPATLSDANNILAGSFSQMERADRRVSEVWTAYKQRNVADGIADSNFDVFDIIADLGAESDNEYGEPSIRRIYSRWLTTRALVTETNSKILGRFSDIVKEIRIDVDAKDRQYGVGDIVYVEHYAIIDEYGQKDVRLWQIISAEETVPGEVTRLVLDDATTDGVVTVYGGASSTAWVGDGTDPFQGMWYSADNGLFPDGSSATRMV